MSLSRLFCWLIALVALLRWPLATTSRPGRTSCRSLALHFLLGRVLLLIVTSLRWPLAIATRLGRTGRAHGLGHVLVTLFPGVVAVFVDWLQILGSLLSLDVGAQNIHHVMPGHNVAV
ncbi:hypothetical protein EDD21DRAFT_47031, partial [Dissophora ornata]